MLMRQWILAGILVASASWGVWMLVQHHRAAQQLQHNAALAAAYQQANDAFYSENYGVAEKLFTDILPDAERSYPNDRRLASLLSMLGTSYRAEHKYEQAEPILKRSLQVYKAISPADPLGTERTELNLVGIDIEREDYASAESYLSDALLLSEKTGNAGAYERGNILLQLGFLRMVQGRYPEAEQLLSDAVKSLAPDRTRWGQTDLASAFYRLGGVYARESRYPEAIEHYQKALEIQEKLLGPDSREVSVTLEGLAETYADLGDGLQATKLLKQAQDLARHAASPDSELQERILFQQGKAAENQGQYAQAETLFEQAMKVAETTAGPDDPRVALALVYLGSLYRDQPQFDIRKARPLLERALAIREKALGADNATTASTLSELSLLSFYEKRPAEAERLAEQALPIQEKAYGPESYEVSMTLNRLGLAQRDLKKLPQAEASLKRALAIRQKTLPPNHPWIAISLDNLASVYIVEGEFQKAAPLIKQARAIR